MSERANAFCKEIKKYTDLISPTALERIDSTNSYAKELCGKGAKEGDCVFALNQSGGRGRMGRSFFSYDGGIYMSLILKPELSADGALSITTAAAVAVSEAIERLFGKDTKIKWVNDIYIGDKKVCGILTEGAIGEGGKLSYAILGIGINLGRPEKFPEEISAIAASILDCSDNLELKAKLVAQIMNIFFEIYKNIDSKDYMERYRERSYLTGKTVEYIKYGIPHTALVSGIDDNAGLKIIENGKEITLTAGEVSVRKQSSQNKFTKK